MPPRLTAAGAGGVAPTSRVRDIDELVRTLGEAGLAPLHEVASLGEGKRLASFRDADGKHVTP